MDLYGRSVRRVSEPEHRVVGDVDQHRSSRVDFRLVLVKRETLRVSVVAVYVLVEIRDHGIAPGLEKLAQPVTPVAFCRFACGVVVNRRPAGVVVESRRTVDVVKRGLVRAHEVGRAVGVSMLRPAPGNVGVRRGAFGFDPVVVDMAACGSAVDAGVRCAERAFAHAPGRVVQRHQAAVRRAGIYVGVVPAVVVAGHHGARGRRAAVTPVERRHIADYSGHVIRSRRRRHAEVFGRTPPDDDPVDKVAVPILDRGYPRRV